VDCIPSVQACLSRVRYYRPVSAWSDGPLQPPHLHCGADCIGEYVSRDHEQDVNLVTLSHQDSFSFFMFLA